MTTTKKTDWSPEGLVRTVNYVASTRLFDGLPLASEVLQAMQFTWNTPEYSLYSRATLSDELMDTLEKMDADQDTVDQVEEAIRRMRLMPTLTFIDLER